MFLSKECNRLAVEIFTGNFKIWLLISLSFGKAMKVVVMKFCFVSIIDKESEIKRSHFALLCSGGSYKVTEIKPRLKLKSSELKNWYH